MAEHALTETFGHAPPKKKFLREPSRALRGASHWKKKSMWCMSRQVCDTDEWGPTHPKYPCRPKRICQARSQLCGLPGYVPKNLSEDLKMARAEHCSVLFQTHLTVTYNWMGSKLMEISLKGHAPQLNELRLSPLALHCVLLWPWRDEETTMRALQQVMQCL